jgi:hypothetical protein
VVANPESLEETLSGRGEPSTFLSGPAALAMVKMEPLTQDGQDQEPCLAIVTRAGAAGSIPHSLVPSTFCCLLGSLLDSRVCCGILGQLLYYNMSCLGPNRK